MSDTFLNERYRLESELGQGGGGTIYQALDTLLDRQVAVKLLAGHGLGSQGRARLLREAKAAARLNHPNIVSVFDAGETGGKAFIIMELVEGESLHIHRPADLDETLSIFRQICAALEHAHQHGIVHRDLKPENVLITTDGLAKLTDFGLSRPVASRLSAEGEITGTVYYLAPEQALGQQVDTRTDLYALGVMLYEIVAGRLPFDAEDPIAIISQHLYAPVVPPRLHNPQVPLTLDTLIVQLMAKTPAERPNSALEVKQRLEKIAAGEVGPTVSAEPVILERMARGRIVGRERELREARKLWEQARGGQGQLLLVSGEPGVGKSRYAREIIATAEVSGGFAALGECYPEGSSPYAPFAQIFRRLFTNSAIQFPEPATFILADLISISPALQALFPDAPQNPHLDPQAEQQRLFENVLAFFSALSAQFPILLVLEDVHWADQASLALLRYLARRARRLRLMAIATYREVELDESQPLQDTLLTLNRERLAERLKLTRLDRQGTHQLLDAMLGEQVPDEFLEGIYQETEGNPFFVEEVCKSLVESGKLYFADGHWVHPDHGDLQIPQSIRITIQARIGKLAEVHQEALRIAAILGREFDFEILSNACEQSEDELIDALEAAERAQLIEETSSERGGTFRFVHALIPLTLIEGLSGLRRRRLHRRAAQVIERLRPNDLEALAYQYSQAEDPEKAWPYLMKAGERAQARFANEDAIRYYTRALEFCESCGTLHFDLLAARARIYDLLALRDKQLADIQRLQALAEEFDEDRLRFQALIALVDYYSSTNFILAREPGQAALALAHTIGEPQFEAQALYRIAMMAWREGDLQHSQRYAEVALEKFKQAGMVAETISCLYMISLNHINQGEHAQGQAAAEEAVRLSRQIKNRRQEATSLRRLGIALQAQSKYAEALNLYQSALAMHREIGDRAEECNGLNAVAGSLAEQGRLEEARVYFLNGIELAEAIGNDFAAGMLITNFVYSNYELPGDYNGALGYLEAQIKKARHSGDQSQNFILARMLMEILGDFGKYESALESAQEALALAQQRGEKRNAIDLLSWVSRFYALAGNPLESERHLQKSLELVENSAEPQFYVDPYFNAAFIAWFSDDPAGWEKALEYIHKVKDILQRVNARNPLVYTLDMEARLLLALNDPGAALSCTSEALQIAQGVAHTSGAAHLFYTHSRALRNLGRESEANAALQQAYEQVTQIAARLDDDSLKQSWLKRDIYNRQILASWEASDSGTAANESGNE